MAKFVDKSLSTFFFKQLDTAMQKINVNASLKTRISQASSKNPKKLSKLDEELRPFFGDETDSTY